MKFPLEAKKSLGQNFLHNKTIIGKIAEIGEIEEGEYIIEIGPGTGELTAGILAEIEKKGLKKVKLIAIEKDHRAIPVLNERFSREIERKRLQIIEGDFLDFDLKTLISRHIFKIIANIPYYITGAIIRKSLESDPKPKKLVFLVQKEVAKRIIKSDKKGSILSNSIEFYGKPALKLAVSRGNFTPSPKVDSAVISIDITSKKSKKQINFSDEWFFDILHAGFAHKRKVLASNLKPFFKKNDIKTSPENIFEKINLKSKIRAEELTIEDWISLANNLAKLSKKKK